VSFRDELESGLFDDETNELRDYHAWRRHQYDDTPLEYWGNLDTSWQRFREDREEEEDGESDS
jgi:hypothetical protein